MGALIVPKGLFTRSARDYQLATLGCGHVDNVSGLVNSTVSLFNNAADGTELGVLAIIISENNQGGTLPIRIQKGTLGTFARNCQNPRLGDPSTWGQLFQGTDPNPVNNYRTNLFQLGMNNSAALLISDWPMFYLLPGFSLIIGSDSTAQVCCNFWFTQE